MHASRPGILTRLAGQSAAKGYIKSSATMATAHNVGTCEANMHYAAVGKRVMVDFLTAAVSVDTWALITAATIQRIYA